MKTYTVHLYREMRLTFTGITANTPEGAATSACDAASEAAASWEDCEGETFSALVDLDGDAEFEHSRVIDFPEGRLRQAAPKLADALDCLLGETVDRDLEDGVGLTDGQAAAREQALSALAEARGEAGASEPTP
jgi:hypothetical protein